MPKSLQNQSGRSLIETAHNQAIYFNIAVNYGSRNEIAKVYHQLASKVQL